MILTVYCKKEMSHHDVAVEAVGEPVVGGLPLVHRQGGVAVGTEAREPEGEAQGLPVHRGLHDGGQQLQLLGPGVQVEHVEENVANCG